MSQLEQALKAATSQLRKELASAPPAIPPPSPRWAVRRPGEHVGDVYAEDGAEAIQRALKKWPQAQWVEPYRS